MRTGADIGGAPCFLAILHQPGPADILLVTTGTPFGAVAEAGLSFVDDPALTGSAALPMASMTSELSAVGFSVVEFCAEAAAADFVVVLVFCAVVVLCAAFVAVVFSAFVAAVFVFAVVSDVFVLPVPEVELLVP